MDGYLLLLQTIPDQILEVRNALPSRTPFRARTCLSWLRGDASRPSSTLPAAGLCYLGDPHRTLLWPAPHPHHEPPSSMLVSIPGERPSGKCAHGLSHCQSALPLAGCPTLPSVGRFIPYLTIASFPYSCPLQPFPSPLRTHFSSILSERPVLF